MQRSRLRKLKRPEGRCYEVSAKTVLDQNEGVLIHGTVFSIPNRCRIGHAWVELPVGTVVEDGTGDSETLKVPAVLDLTLKEKLRLLPKDCYFRIGQAAEERRYTVTEVRTMILREQNWGPWHVTAGKTRELKGGESNGDRQRNSGARG